MCAYLSSKPDGQANFLRAFSRKSIKRNEPPFCSGLGHHPACIIGVVQSRSALRRWFVRQMRGFRQGFIGAPTEAGACPTTYTSTNPRDGEAMTCSLQAATL